MKKTLLAFGLSLLLAAAAGAQTEPQVSVNVLDYGVYAAVTAKPNAATATNGTTQDLLENIRLIAQTRTVVVGNAAGKNSVEFGFHYAVVGSPKGTKVSLREVVRFPEPGVVRDGKHVLWDELVDEKEIGSSDYTGWGFDGKTDPDVLPGDWTIELWYGNQKLASQIFTVVK